VVQQKYRSDQITTQPRLAVPAVAPVRSDEKPEIPALLAAYLRMGARVCGEPCWDPEFNCADLFVLLNVKDLPKRYARRFLSAA
jgi:putative hemolysin